MGFAGIFSDKPYLEQFHRIQRWRERLYKISFSNASEKEIDNHIDFIYAYFINCYHLKDWLIMSKVVSEEEVNNFIKNHKELRICQDICNGSKHLFLTNPSLGQFPLAKQFTPLSRPSPIKNTEYVVLTGEGNLDVFELADNCLKLWTEFMISKKLL